MDWFYGKSKQDRGPNCSPENPCIGLVILSAPAFLIKVAALGIRHIEPLTALKVDSKRPEVRANEEMPAEVRKELKRLGYRGLTTIDFEHDTPALQEDMARNVRFMKEQAEKLLR